MKKITTSLFALLFSLSIFAQSFEEEYIINSGNENTEEIENTEENSLKNNKINYNFNVGTAFTAWRGGSMFSTYLNPNLNYQFTPKFSVSTGVVISNNTLLSNYYSSNGEEIKRNFVDSYLQVSGIYQVNEKLQITGSVMYHTNTFSPQMNANAFDNLDYSISAKYKLTKNIEVGVQLSKRTYNPYMPYNYDTDSFNENK